MTGDLPLGVRNQNPGNIEYSPSVKWQGLADPPSDGRFCRFVSPVYGIRAIARVLITYQDKHGINTVREAINRWAPPTENNTRAYVEHVADLCGVKPGETVDLHSYAILRPMVEAIIHHENGMQPYIAAQIDKALVLAGVEPEAKPLAASRTMKGGAAAGLSTAALAATEAAQSIEPLVPYLDTLKWVFLALMLIGIGVTMYARWDDARKALR